MSYGEIKSTINSSIGNANFKPLNDLIKDDVAALNTKLDNISGSIAGIGSSISVPIVKSIQYGTSKISSDNSETTVYINTVNPKKSIVIINGSIGKRNDTTAQIQLYLISFSSDWMHIGNDGGEAAQTAYFSWQIIEFY